MMTQWMISLVHQTDKARLSLLSPSQTERQHCQAVELLELRHGEVVNEMKEAHMKKLGHLEKRIQELQMEVAGLKDRARSTAHLKNKSPGLKVDSPRLSKTPPARKGSPALKSDLVSHPSQAADTSGVSEQTKSHFTTPTVPHLLSPSLSAPPPPPPPSLGAPPPPPPPPPSLNVQVSLH